MKVVSEILQLFPMLLQWSRGVPRSRVTLLVVTVAGIIAGFSNMALIAIINAALHSGAYSPVFLVATFIGLCITIPVSGFASQALLARLTAQAGRDIRSRLCDQILSAPLRMLEEIGSHRLFAALTEDIPAITSTVSALPALFTQSAVIVGSLLYLGWLSPVLLLSVLGYMVVGILTYQLFLAKSVTYFRLLREEWDAMIKALRGLTDGTKELKLHRLRRHHYLSNHLDPIMDSIQRYNIKANTISFAAGHWGQVLFYIFIGLILFGAPQFIEIDRKTLTGYALTILYMNSPLAGLLNLLPNLGRANVAFQKIRKIGLSLTEQSSETNLSSSSEPNPSWRELELHGVSHSYRLEGGLREFTLGPLDLSLKRGELVFLIGGNGSGKTTLAKLLSGLYAPESGEIRLDGKAITGSDRDDYRQHFSAVFADFYLFEKLFGIDALSLDHKLQNYLSELRLNEKVQIRDGAFSTIDLSQGQRKRLALLVAYLEDRSLYIFDEWAADQDPEFKQIFYYQILAELKASGKTLIVISHDDRFYHLADRIIKLERGQIEYDRQITASFENVHHASAPLAF